MSKRQNFVIIISDDEMDESPPVQQNDTTLTHKYGYSQTNPITLDIDDYDKKLTPIIKLTPDQFSASTESSLFTPSSTSRNDTNAQQTATVTTTTTTTTETKTAAAEIAETTATMATAATTAAATTATAATTTSKSDMEMTSLSASTCDVFGLSNDILDFISKQHGIQPKVFLEDEPDWSFIAEIESAESSEEWEPPKLQSPAVDIKISEESCLNEMLTRLDYYQHSMNRHVEGLQPKLSKEDLRKTDSLSPGISPTSSTGIILTPSLPTGRNTVKRNTTISYSHTTRATRNNKLDHQAILTRLLDAPYSSMLQRPYVPVAVWQGSNWEDWAQFAPGELIHVPFTEDEDFVVNKMAQKLTERKRKVNSKSLPYDSIAWSQAPILLPGRESQDCCFRYMDIMESKNHLFQKPQLVTRVKIPSKAVQNYHDLLTSRQISGKVCMNKHHSVVWMNMSTEVTIGGGSGDASCILLEGDARTTDSLQLIAGSVCDDNQSYNMEGNLREWKSSTGKIEQLKGHFIETDTSDGGTQVSWRTVHDIKTSNDKKLIFSASRDRNAKIWSRETRKLLSTLVCHGGPVHQIAVKPGDENIIATGSADGSGVIWKITKGGKNGQGEVCATEMVDDLDHCSVECLEFGHGASDQKLFMGYRTEISDNLGWITAFDARTADPLYNIRDMRGSVGCMAISQSGKHILSGNDSVDGGDQMLHVNDVITGKSILKARTGHLDVNCVAFSRCDNYIASGSVNNQISIYDMRKPSRPVYEFLHDNCRQNNGRFLAPDAGIGISGMYWMKNNNILITAGGDCAVNLWDVSGRNGLLKSYKTADPISCLAVNEDLHTLAAGASGSQGMVHIWRP